jgi:hypothetical protein
MHELFGEAIHTYTRAQALADGVLVDVTEWASAEKGFLGGFRWRVAVTAAVWQDLNDIPEWAQGWQDVRGRAHDLLWMASLAVRQAAEGESEVLFDVILSLSGDPEPRDGRGQGELSSTRTYKLVCGPNDDGSPCLTVMRVDED